MSYFQSALLLLQLLLDLVKAVKAIDRYRGRPMTKDERREIKASLKSAMSKAVKEKDTSELEAVVRRLGA